LDAERIHDLRVAARRLVELLDVFKSFLPKGAKEARRELRQMMTLAGEVRNLDIAIELLRSVGAPPAAALIQTLRDERASAESRLGELLRRQHRTEASLRWRQALDLAP
jgi:CHAD domain-containing protein